MRRLVSLWSPIASGEDLENGDDIALHDGTVSAGFSDGDVRGLPRGWQQHARRRNHLSDGLQVEAKMR